jgi:hypothetical protein
LVNRYIFLYNFFQLQICTQFLLFLQFLEVYYQNDYHHREREDKYGSADYYCVSPPCELFLLRYCVKFIFSWLRYVGRHRVSYCELLQNELGVGTIYVLVNAYYILFW